MLLQIIVFLSLALCLITAIHSTYNLENEVDYWESLIKSSLNSAKSYKIRTDNSDFYKNLESGPTREFGNFDFIIVGGGTAGSLLAAELTEVENWNVLLLEAGDVDDDILYMPFFFGAYISSNRNWGYLTTPQEPYSCLGRIDNRCPMFKPKILGGSSCVNAMIWNRGTAADYNSWEKMGNPGWSWKNILPLYKKIENYQSPNIDTRFRGFGGPINTVYTNPYNDKEFEHYKKVNEEFGIPYIEDYQASSQIGVSKIQLNINQGKRVSASTAYVRPNWHRHNFNVTVKAFVTKILIDHHKRAYGVEFIIEGVKYKATASKEIILSAGAVNSPQILMLSGIGPASELKKHKIPIVQDLPVGRYLKDHPLLMLYYETNIKVPNLKLRPLVRKFLKGYGPLTSFNSVTGQTLVNLRNDTLSSPNIQLIFDPRSHICPLIGVRDNSKPNVAEAVGNAATCGNWMGEIFLLQPKSVGNLTLQSSDPKDFPLVNVGMFTDDDDLKVMYEAVKLMNKLLLNMPYNVSVIKMSFCSDHEFDSDDYWYCVIRYLTYPIIHISGTTKMGPKSDRLAVVDHELKVYGIKNLRVADCSIIPEMISGNHVAPAYVVGAKAAELIKEKHLSQAQ